MNGIVFFMSKENGGGERFFIYNYILREEWRQCFGKVIYVNMVQYYIINVDYPFFGISSSFLAVIYVTVAFRRRFFLQQIHSFIRSFHFG